MGTLMLKYIHGCLFSPALQGGEKERKVKGSRVDKDFVVASERKMEVFQWLIANRESLTRLHRIEAKYLVL